MIFLALQSDYQAFKKPRTLNQRQFDAIVDFLSTRDSQRVTVAYVRADRKSRQYAISFSNALAKARWTITMAELDDASPAVVIESYNPGVGNKRTKAAVLLKAAFKDAQLDGWGESQTGNGGPEETRLVVGPKRN